MYSPFASRVRKTIEVPFDPPHTITIQKLPGRHLERASNDFFGEMTALMMERGGAKVQKEIEQVLEKADRGDQTTKAELEAVKKNPLNGFHKPTLIKYGLKDWSYDTPLDANDPTKNEALLSDLDQDFETFVATEIMRLTKPELFQTKDEQEVARKNDSSPSTVP